MKAGARTPGVERTVLVVDDDANLRCLIETLLLRAGYRVQTAQDAASAHQRLRAASADLLVLDLSLPGMDGFAFLGQLRQEPATSRLPVLVVSAYSDAESRAGSASLAVGGFLTKPFRGRDLVAAVGRILDHTHH